MSTQDGGNDELRREDMSAKTHNESESLSDIDDLEVHNQSSFFLYYLAPPS